MEQLTPHLVSTLPPVVLLVSHAACLMPLDVVFLSKPSALSRQMDVDYQLDCQLGATSQNNYKNKKVFNHHTKKEVRSCVRACVHTRVSLSIWIEQQRFIDVCVTGYECECMLVCVCACMRACVCSCVCVRACVHTCTNLYLI